MLPLFLLFIVLPIAELCVIIQIGGAIGVLPTRAPGGRQPRRRGARAVTEPRGVERFNRALGEGRVPGQEVYDGAMIILGGALLLAPGFITDIVGLCLLLPPTRALLRRFLTVRSRSARGSRGASRLRLCASRRAARPGPAYDYEGSAREVTEPPAELPDPTPTPERG